MAERRMFAKTIIDSDAFTDMPLSTQALYFHLSMRADDDGFINNPKKIQRMIGASDDDLKVLVMKRFIIPFESGIVVIKHWKIHNYIRGDRKKDTMYPEEMSMLIEKDNGAYYLVSSDAVVIDSPKDETPRQKAYKESSLPYSFEYKIRQAFSGEVCPVCGFVMRGSVDECGVGSDNRRPTIQHNKPISKGGKHELGNISVICHQCNVTLKDTETGKLNADEVTARWNSICMSGKCQSSDSQLTDKCQASDSQVTVKCQSSDGKVTDNCQKTDGHLTEKCPHRLGKVSLVEESIVKESKGESAAAATLDDECVDKSVEKSEELPWDDRPFALGQTLGKNVVYLSNRQFAELLDTIGADDFRLYVERLADFIINKNAHVKNHFETILKWYKEDHGG